MSTPAKLAVFVSGIGSLLEAMLEQNVPVRLVVADRACQGLQIAAQAGIPTVLVDRAQFKASQGFRRTAYTRALVMEVRDWDIQKIAMAGFMTRLARPMFDAYGDNILNNHPSLLPAFKGDNAVAAALAYGAKVTGFTIHVATLKLDSGPILFQTAVTVEESDTEATLHERIKVQERIHYPAYVNRWIAERD